MARNIKLYEIQKRFIKSAQSCIKNGETGIFSSPTGTGKTISLLLSIEPYLTKNKICNFSGLSDKNIELLRSFNFDRIPIYYASRTHSQLKQAIEELKNLEIECNALVIGSRMLYCIHEEIKKSNNIDVINEKCKKAREKDKCVFYTNYKAPEVSETDVQKQTEDQFDNILAKRIKTRLKDDKQLEKISMIEQKLPILKKFRSDGIHDIEDLKGNGCGFCPYYKSKELAKTASIIFLPYQMLFSKESRKSFNLKLEDAIIIIDEAHNIYETVIQINSAIVYYDQLYKYNSAFKKYRMKLENTIIEKENHYKNNFIKRRKMILDSFIDILSLLYEFCDSVKTKYFQEENVLFVNDFLIKSHLQNYNMLILQEYLKTTNIIQILEGFESGLQLGLYTIVNFLVLLTNSDNNGIILYDSKKIRFTPLDAKLYFEEMIVCRSLILAGGTMEPLDSLLRVFPNSNVHSYNSVCENFTAHILSSSPSGKKLRLTFEQRENTLIMKELSLTMKNLINCARSALEKGNGHGGIVCFVPSKAFLESFKLVFSCNIDKKLTYHFENLKEFEKDCQSKTTVLFAVMGGSLSEGINFSDNFCRMLFIVGLPFPSVTPEIRERIKFDGQSFLINIAMKTINQALGRALRHRNDFASIVLVDQRYERYKDMLSPWIKKKIEIESFRNVFKQIHEFLISEVKKIL